MVFVCLIYNIFLLFSPYFILHCVGKLSLIKFTKCCTRIEAQELKFLKPVVNLFTCLVFAAKTVDFCDDECKTDATSVISGMCRVALH